MTSTNNSTSSFRENQPSEYMRADELKPGDRILRHGRWHEVSSVKRDGYAVYVTVREQVSPLHYFGNQQLSTITAKVEPPAYGGGGPSGDGDALTAAHYALLDLLLSCDLNIDEQTPEDRALMKTLVELGHAFSYTRTEDGDKCNRLAISPSGDIAIRRYQPEPSGNERAAAATLDEFAMLVLHDIAAGESDGDSDGFRTYDSMIKQELRAIEDDLEPRYVESLDYLDSSGYEQSFWIVTPAGLDLLKDGQS